MALVLLLLIPLLGGLLCLAAPKQAARWVALVVTIAELVVALSLLRLSASDAVVIAQLGVPVWWQEINVPWIPSIGIHFHLAVDGLSFLMILLTAFLGIMSVGISWRQIRDRVKFYYFNLLLILSGIVGVFLSLDLFLFYFFWEIMLIPMYFLISLWGYERRVYAAIKFFLFTQASGLLMFLSILALFFIHGGATGQYTFDYMALLGTSLSPGVAMWIMLGFVVAFIVKVPALPFHTWLPDAHTEAPTAGSLILAGLLLKTGAYGLLRFVLPLFPGAAAEFAPIAMGLGVAGILYGAILAFAQKDLKRLVAYTSVSHMGFVLLAVFARNQIALQGAVMEMICHGLSTGALFMLVGALQERIHTRDMEKMGGLWSTAPRMGAIALFFALASLGLPGLGNFIAEFLILFGAFQANLTLTIIAILGLVFAAIYSLWIIQKSFQGDNDNKWSFADLSAREMVLMLSMAALLVWLGLHPQPTIRIADPALRSIQAQVSAPMLASANWGVYEPARSNPQAGESIDHDDE